MKWAALLGLILFWTYAKPVQADLDDLGDERLPPRKTSDPSQDIDPDLGDVPQERPQPTPAKPSGTKTIKSGSQTAQPSPNAAPAPTKDILQGGHERQGEGHDNTAPINWKAKGFKGTRSGKLIELKQDVEVTQDKMKLTADRAEIYFDDKDELSKVHATGNVKIKKDAVLARDRISARGNEADFYNSERKVVLKGKAMLTRGGDVVRGKQISYDLDTGWITVDSVEGVVQPQESSRP